MPRFGCYELRTECNHCGNPVPINGPLRRVKCSYCLETLSIGPDALKGLLEDLVDEWHELAEREGRGGTVMSDRTYKYGYWRLPPRCSKCEEKLDLEGAPEDGHVVCTCGHRYAIYPAPDWLRERLPAEVIVGGEREGPDGATPVEQAEALEPIVMACPQCGGGLKVTQEWDRVHRCQYCEAQVFIPDALWKRLHPVKKVTEWFVGYADQPGAQPVAEVDDAFDDDAPTTTAGEIATRDTPVVAVDTYEDASNRGVIIGVGITALLVALGVILLALG